MGHHDEEEQLSEEDQERMREDDTDSATTLLFTIEKWWPWVKGWNVKSEGWLDIFLLFLRPSQARHREELLRDLARCGHLSELDPTDFIRVNVAFCWRERSEGELVGEVQGPIVLDATAAVLRLAGRPPLKRTKRKRSIT